MKGSLKKKHPIFLTNDFCSSTLCSKLLLNFHSILKSSLTVCNWSPCLRETLWFYRTSFKVLTSTLVVLEFLLEFGITACNLNCLSPPFFFFFS